MPSINLLPSEVADMIAAGEVVERPASVVKELIENSIDAGADKITVEIKNGGVSFIRVTDNGCGMDREDAEKCFLRHATSKLKTALDLEEIITMGFRGEALAALCAVSKLELMTKRKGELTGTRVVAAAGKIIDVSEAGCPEGTTMVVRDLFFNTPARQKFLKKEITESAAVSSAVDRAALAANGVSFTYIKDGRRELFTRGEGLRDAVREVLGRELLHKTAEVTYTEGGVSVTGFVGLPEAARPNRNMQYFFLNNRYIKSRVLTAALEEALKNSLLTEKFPICVLNVQIQPRAVDVNVHPAKTEVKFFDERTVYDGVFFGVKNAVFGTEQRPRFELKPLIKTDSKLFSQPPMQQHTFDNRDVFAKPLHSGSLYGGIKLQSIDIEKNEQEINEERKALPTENAKDEQINVNAEKAPFPTAQQAPPIKGIDFRLAGKLFDQYILIELEDELLIIDKHAAQERIKFEKLKSEKGDAAAQTLLIPKPVELARDEYEAVKQNRELFLKLGFDTEDFGAGTILVRSVPLDLCDQDAEDLVIEISQMIVENKKEIAPQVYDEILHSIACKASVKAGSHSSDSDMQALAEQIVKMPDIRCCPHGRPVAMSLTKYAIDRQFKRC